MWRPRRFSPHTNMFPLHTPSAHGPVAQLQPTLARLCTAQAQPRGSLATTDDAGLALCVCPNFADLFKGVEPRERGVAAVTVAL
jgi:hypothetical protein